MLKIIAAIVVFCLLILSHEFGHFIVAKACRVRVEDFSIGMGPKLLGWRRGETQYALRLFPIGGYCRMTGEDESSTDPHAFCNKKISQRIAVIAAGPLMNFLCAILLFVIVFMMIGTYSDTSTVGEVIENSAAEEAGLMTGDVILALDNQPITLWSEISPTVAEKTPGQALAITIERNGQTMTVLLTPRLDAEDGTYRIGIYPAQVRQNLFTAIWLGCKQSVLFVREMFVAIVAMIRGTMQVDVSGPVGIVNAIGDATSYGFASLLLLTGYLCLNLGLINLLPLPALDGSRIVFLLVEAVRKKPINPEREGMVHFIGLMMLFALMLFVTYKDIVRLIVGS